jgi:deazaflavin-dependent oxidoreductase (nitroreductase family)
VDLTFRILGGLHTKLYGLSGGAVGGHMGKAPVLLLTTTGRKTGKRRTNPLLYLEDGDDLVVVASKGGAPANPAWFLNLEADPDAVVQVKREQRRVRARRATPEERARLWPKVNEIWERYDSYQSKTTREIPLVILEPR